jgi:hypothetical protein
LPILAIVTVGVLVNMWWPARTAVLGAHTNLSSASLLTETNKARATSNALGSLQLSTALNKAAEAKAEDMVARNYWSHNTPDAKAPWSFISAAGYSYETAGENLAYGFEDAGSALAAWMHSPSHRANVLSTEYRQVGFGIASSPDYMGKGPETIIVAMYASPATSYSTAVQPVQTTTAAVKGSTITTQPVSRVALLSAGQTSLLPMIVASLTTLGLATFVFRHGRALHRSLVKGEVFVMSHPLLDITLVAIVTAGFVLGQASGYILSTDQLGQFRHTSPFWINPTWQLYRLAAVG